MLHEITRDFSSERTSWKPVICPVIGLLCGIICGRIYLDDDPFSPIIDSTSKINSSNQPPTYCSSNGANTRNITGYGGHGLTNANRLEDVHVLCWIMTHPSNVKKKAIYVRDTWARRCNKFLFMSDEANELLPALGLNVTHGRIYLSFKTRAALEYIYRHHFNDADWFFKADDDTYVIMENLRHLLFHLNPDHPIYIGHPFKLFLKQGYMSGGSGYVLSKEALRMFTEKGLHLCNVTVGEAEDFYIGKCMERLGIPTYDARDIYNHTRFHPYGTKLHISNGRAKEYSVWDAYDGMKGIAHVSDYAITFHYVTPTQMRQIDYFVYRLQLRGLRNQQK